MVGAAGLEMGTSMSLISNWKINHEENEGDMRKQYNLKKMKWKANPYLGRLKKSVTIRMDQDVIEYLKDLNAKTGTPSQTRVNDFL